MDGLPPAASWYSFGMFSDGDMDGGSETAAGDQLREAVAAHSWYHTIELAPGLETPGWFDLRPVASDILPSSLTGQRCLDVATFDGFWSLEMKKRGAREVVAIDILDPREWDWPVLSDESAIAAIGERKASGDGFGTVMRALGENVERHDLSVYALDPADLGMFDFVYVGSLILHLRDPVKALEKVRSVCSGQMVLVDSHDPFLTWTHPRRPVATLDGIGRPWWWHANIAGLSQMVRAGGFDLVKPPGKVLLKPGAGRQDIRLTWKNVRSRAVRNSYRLSRIGDPHAVLTARPRHETRT